MVEANFLVSSASSFWLYFSGICMFIFTLLNLQAKHKLLAISSKSPNG